MNKLALSGLFAIAVTLSLGVMAQQAPTARGINPDYPAMISNQNVWNLYQQYQYMIEEIDKSVTRGNAGLLSHDAARWLSYINGMRAYVGYWASQSFIDFPVTHGRDWNLTGPLNPACDFKSNLAACEMMALAVGARDELALSASANLPIHLYPADAQRQEDYWKAMEGYIGYMAANSPLDQPVTAAEERLGLKPGFDTPAP